MIIKTYGYEEGSIKYALQDTEKAIKEVFPNVNTGDNYFLFIRTSIYYPYITNKIDSTIVLYDLDNNIIAENTKYKIRTPYPNKNIYFNDMRVGRKLCDGFVLMFNTIDELHKASRVEINWNIDSEYDNKEPFKLNSTIIYNTKFIKVEGNNVFTIKSADSFQVSFKNRNEEQVLEYQKQFDKNNYEKLRFNNIDVFNETHIQNLELLADNTRVQLP